MRPRWLKPRLPGLRQRHAAIHFLDAGTVEDASEVHVELGFSSCNTRRKLHVERNGVPTHGLGTNILVKTDGPAGVIDLVECG